MRVRSRAGLHSLELSVEGVLERSARGDGGVGRESEYLVCRDWTAEDLPKSLRVDGRGNWRPHDLQGMARVVMSFSKEDMGSQSKNEWPGCDPDRLRAHSTHWGWRVRGGDVRHVTPLGIAVVTVVVVE